MTRMTFYHYDWATAEVVGLNAISVQPRKRAHSGGCLLGSETLPAVSVCYVPGSVCTKVDAKRLAVTFFRCVDETGSADSPAPLDVPDDIDIFEINDRLNWGIEDLVPAVSGNEGVRRVMESLNARLMVCRSDAVTGLRPVIGLAVKGVEDSQEVRFSTGKYEELEKRCKEGTLEVSRLEVEAIEAKGRIASLGVSLKAEIAEVSRFLESQNADVTEQGRLSVETRARVASLEESLSAEKTEVARLKESLKAGEAEARDLRRELDVSEFEAGGLKEELLVSELREVKTRGAVTAARREASEERIESARAKVTLARLRLEVGTIASDVKGAPGVMDDLISDEMSLLVSRIRRATVDSVEGMYEKLLEAVRSNSPENSRSLPDSE